MILLYLNSEFLNVLTTHLKLSLKHYRDMDIVFKCYQDLLLNQFHDVLPGSCIEFAAIDAWSIYEDMFAKLRELRAAYNTRLLAPGTTKRAIYNALPWQAKTVIFIKPDTLAPPTGP